MLSVLKAAASVDSRSSSSRNGCLYGACSVILKIVPGWGFPSVAFQLAWRVWDTKIIIIKFIFSSKKLSVWNGYITDILIRSTSSITKRGHPKLHLSIKAMRTVAKIVKMNFFRTLEIILQQSKEHFFFFINNWISELCALWHCNFPIGNTMSNCRPTN